MSKEELVIALERAVEQMLSTVEMGTDGYEFETPDGVAVIPAGSDLFEAIAKLESMLYREDLDDVED